MRVTRSPGCPTTACRKPFTWMIPMATGWNSTGIAPASCGPPTKRGTCRWDRKPWMWKASWLYWMPVSPWYLKINIGAEPKSQVGNARMIQVSEPFDQVNPDNGEYIVNADTGLQVGLPVQDISSQDSIGQRESHLRKVT